MTAVHGTLSVRCEFDDTGLYDTDVQSDACTAELDLKPAGETSAANVADRIAHRVATTVGEHRFNMWFRRSARMAYCDQRRCLEVAVPNRFVADWIGRHFQGHLVDAARDELGAAVNLSLHVDPARFAGRSPRPGERDAADQAQGVRRLAPRRPVRRGPQRGCDQLRHNLDDFIVGPSNRLAYEAARRMAEGDAATGSSLFIHGGVGLGKTHLLQGLCERMRAVNFHARVLYTTAEQFTNAFVTAVRAGELDQFRRRYRQLDLLALDDVHFIANKQATQQEFLHSIDTIELAGARVALASDSHPREIRQFSDALVSRCLRGMVVQIHTPDTPTRAQIVTALAQRRGISLRETVVAMLAERCRGSVRELEGTLVKLQAMAQLEQQRAPVAADPADMQAQNAASTGDAAVSEGAHPVIGHVLASRLFQTSAGLQERGPVRLAAIMERVSQRTGVPIAQITGRGRRGPVVLARSLTAYLTRQLTDMSYPEIASALHRSSHSSVVAAVQRVEAQLAARHRVELADGKASLWLSELVDELREQLGRPSGPSR